MAVLGVIPARGGSKRFPRKNVAPFRGRPLITWTIREAQKSVIDGLVVSTDDLEIRLASIALGCIVITRPSELATDEAMSEDVLRHALQTFKAEYVVLLQPTSPLRTAEDINECLRMCHVEHKPVVSYRPDGTKNGAVYVAPAQWLKNHTFMDDHLHYVMPDERSLDIDYKEDVSV